jgi:hypothetical protein
VEIRCEKNIKPHQTPYPIRAEIRHTGASKMDAYRITLSSGHIPPKSINHIAVTNMARVTDPPAMAEIRRFLSISAMLTYSIYNNYNRIRKAEIIKWIKNCLLLPPPQGRITLNRTTWAKRFHWWKNPGVT